MILYTSLLSRGFTLWPFIILPERIKGKMAEIPYLEHEKAHYISQAWWSPIWIILYFVSKSFRWKEEKKAFSAQLTATLQIDWESIRHSLVSEYWGMATEQDIDNWLQEMRLKHG